MQRSMVKSTTGNMAEYYNIQAHALSAAFEMAQRRGYTPIEPDRLWAEHVGYGETVRYGFSLRVNRTGNMAKKCLWISLYRMPSGRYELTTYLS